MGFVFIPTPGPSYIIIAIGLWLLAGEFLLLAASSTGWVRGWED